jgi:sec-independent protein translocase protein TatA
MIGDILQPTHLIFVLVVALLVLGPKRLPEAGRALGGAIRDFRSAMGGEHDQPSGIATQATAPAAATTELTEPAEPTELTHQPDQVEQPETVNPVV